MSLNRVIPKVDDIRASCFVANFRNASEGVLEQRSFAVALYVVKQGVLSRYFLNARRQFLLIACHKAAVQVIRHYCHRYGTNVMLSDGCTKQGEINETIKNVVKQQIAIDGPLVAVVDNPTDYFSFFLFHSQSGLVGNFNYSYLNGQERARDFLKKYLSSQIEYEQ